MLLKLFFLFFWIRVIHLVGVIRPDLFVVLFKLREMVNQFQENIFHFNRKMLSEWMKWKHYTAFILFIYKKRSIFFHIHLMQYVTGRFTTTLALLHFVRKTISDKNRKTPSKYDVWIIHKYEPFIELASTRWPNKEDQKNRKVTQKLYFRGQ